MRNKQNLIYILVLLTIIGCASSKKKLYNDQPPGFIGRLMQNTTARYNAFYNANFIYQESLIATEDSYQEDYTEQLPVSVQDAVSRSGNMTGEMDEVIQKTATIISKKPYSKWVDDNYLLNGIAHYVKGEYDKAEEIFIYTASEYKNGVAFERVGVRQKIKNVNIEKEKKKQAKERLEELERERKEIEAEVKEKTKSRKQKAKKKLEEREKKQKKILSRDEQFKLKQKAKKEGRDLTTEELLKEIRAQQKVLDSKGKELSDEDRKIIAESPAKVNDNADNPGFLAHPHAAKDAMLWLAKSYITQDKFIAANAVLTAINEDESFPNRLNKDYYLTYADMHIRLNNLTKATEYINLAIESSKNKEKGRLYYILGQLYAEDGYPGKAKEAFATVQKYHPEYNMIYHANMRNIRKDYRDGVFNTYDYKPQLLKMSKDAKNDEFMSEVYFYLAQSYLANGETEKGIEYLEKSVDTNAKKPFEKKDAYLALGQHYYNTEEYKKAKISYQSALTNIQEDNLEKAKTTLYANSLIQIVNQYNIIHLQDSLLNLALLDTDELEKYVSKQVDKELKNLLRDKLSEANSSFGSGVSTTNQPQTTTRRRTTNSDVFYFYDVQQLSSGFSEFKVDWGDRPNVDNWRRSAYIKRFANTRQVNKTETDEEELSREQLIANYIANVPTTFEQQQIANDKIHKAYLKIASVFINDLGDLERGEEVAKELTQERNPTQEQLLKAQELIIVAHKMKDESSYIQSLSSTKDGQQAIDRATNNLVETTDETLYTQAFKAYLQEDYTTVLSLSNEAQESDQSNYSDKFAYITAASKGALEGKLVLATEMRKFVATYPSSALVQKANQFIQ